MRDVGWGTREAKGRFADVENARGIYRHLNNSSIIERNDPEEREMIQQIPLSQYRRDEGSKFSSKMPSSWVGQHPPDFRLVGLTPHHKTRPNIVSSLCIA